jgi:hypothetical protein
MKAVYNLYQPSETIKIQATIGFDTFETPPIAVTYQVRQYTTKHDNATVNEYDALITQWVDYWTHWHYPDEQNPYTFKMDGDEVEDGLEYDLVKAICYKESTMKDKVDLMSIKVNNEQAIKTMKGPKKYPYDLNWRATPDANGKYSMESPNSSVPPTNAAAVFMYYPDANADTQSASIKWGIRWLYSKRTGFDVDETTIPWKVYNLVWRPWGETLERYGDGTLEYRPDVENLHTSGKNPHDGDPQYLWPILTNGSPRN